VAGTGGWLRGEGRKARDSARPRLRVGVWTIMVSIRRRRNGCRSRKVRRHINGREPSTWQELAGWLELGAKWAATRGGGGVGEARRGFIDLFSSIPFCFFFCCEEIVSERDCERDRRRAVWGGCTGSSMCEGGNHCGRGSVVGSLSRW